MTEQKEVTIEQIYEAYPDMHYVIAEAKKARARAEADNTANIWRDYTVLKHQLSRSVGWYSHYDEEGKKWLESMEAYNVAIRALSEALGV